MLLERKVLSEETMFLLSDDYAGKNPEEQRRLRMDIEKAVVALKMAVRMFKPKEGLSVGKGKFRPKNQFKTPERIDIDKYRLSDYEVNTTANVGWLYYRDYYRNYQKNSKVLVTYYDNVGNGKKSKESQTKTMHELLCKVRKNPYILSSRLEGMLVGNQTVAKALTDAGFALLRFITFYPGLVVGFGLNHGTPFENDMKCGFQFDHATGLPVIPGSSVKGVLRSVFPDVEGNSDVLRVQYVRNLLADQGIHFEKDGEAVREVIRLARQIFTHDDLSKCFDVFMDAIITGSSSACFLGDDFLAPHHPNLYKDPVPIQFMKVLPGVEFSFFFRLTPIEIGGHKVDKLRLFRCILEDVGIGAKTNVGYGHLKYADE